MAKEWQMLKTGQTQFFTLPSGTKVKLGPSWATFTYADGETDYLPAHTIQTIREVNCDEDQGDEG